LSGVDGGDEGDEIGDYEGGDEDEEEEDDTGSRLCSLFGSSDNVYLARLLHHNYISSIISLFFTLNY